MFQYKSFANLTFYYDAGGTDYRCKFGGKVVPAVFHFAGGPLANLVWARRGKKWGSARGVGIGAGGPGRHGQIGCTAPPMETPGEVKKNPSYYTPFIHPLYTFIAVLIPMYTQYTYIYTIYTPNTPLNTL